jgi:type IV secretory pathway VirB10-like protein
MRAATRTLSGEAATKALKEFAKELERGRDPSGEKTPDASLIKLARVLIDVIQADRASEKTPDTPNQNKQDVERKKKTVMEPPHKHVQPRKRKKAKMHKQSRTRTASRKAKNRKTKVKVKVKRKKHRKKAKRNSKRSRTTNRHGKRMQKRRRGKN